MWKSTNSKASFTWMWFPIDTVSCPWNHIENDMVSKCLQRTYSLPPLISWRSHSRVLALCQLDLGTSKESMSSRHFVFCHGRKKHGAVDVLISFTDKVTNKYKVSKTAENYDWRSVQKKCGDILDWFKNELEKASGSQVLRQAKSRIIVNLLFSLLLWRVSMKNSTFQRHLCLFLPYASQIRGFEKF